MKKQDVTKILTEIEALGDAVAEIRFMGADNIAIVKIKDSNSTVVKVDDTNEVVKALSNHHLDPNTPYMIRYIPFDQLTSIECRLLNYNSVNWATAEEKKRIEAKVTPNIVMPEADYSIYRPDPNVKSPNIIDL